MPIADLTNRAAIEIDGAEVSADLEPAIQEVVVDDHLYLPDAFEIRVFDPDRSAQGKLQVKIGSKVRISGTALHDATPTLLVSGEVTAVEGAYAEGGSELVIRGYDESHRLTRGRHTATYNQMKYSDIAGQVADRASLERGAIDDSSAVVDYVAQINQSDWDFLLGLARQVDFTVGVAEGKLNFGKPKPASDAPSDGDYSSDNPLQLVFGGNLLSFRPRVTAAGQVTDFQVRGWSVEDKKAVVGSAQAGTDAASLPDDPGSLSSIFGSATFVSVADGPTDQPGADGLAARYRELVGSAFAEAIGVAVGNPNLRAGSAIAVSYVGDPFVGRYTLTHARHVFDLLQGYRTQFTVSGRQDRSMHGLVSGGADAGGSGGGAGSRAIMPGVVVGIVDDTADPKQMGRVKFQLPWLSADYVSDWTRVAALGAGQNRGTLWLPEHGDEVLVAFEQGDMRRPVVIGSLWNGIDSPPSYAMDGGKLQARSLVSRLGHKVVFNDADGTSSIEIDSADGSLSVVLDQTNGEIAIKAGGTSKVSISAQGDIKIEAQGQLSLSGEMGVELKSSGTTAVKGAVVQLN